jgi:MFS family permease
MGLFRELRTWRRLGTTMLPILIISLTLSMINAFYWTIGPLFADSFESLGKFSGLFLASFLAPSLIVGWFVGDITARYGQQRTALGALFFGSLILVSLAVVADEFVILGINLFASFFLAAAYPAINGVYANFIAETPRLEADIEAVEDSSTNMGWVFGPILAGLISDTVGYHYTFVILGIIGMTVAFFVWRIMPRRIHVTPR